MGFFCFCFSFSVNLRFCYLTHQEDGNPPKLLEQRFLYAWISNGFSLDLVCRALRLAKIIKFLDFY